MAHVDYLSRNPVCGIRVCRTDREQPLTTLLEYQEQDEFCKRIANGTADSEESTGYELKNGIVYKLVSSHKNSKVLRCFVPVRARLHTMRLYHDEASHIGYKKGIVKLRETLYWPRMTFACLKKYVSNCRACIKGKTHTGKKCGLMQTGMKAEEPFHAWHIDHAGPLKLSEGCTQILVVIDAFSKYCKFLPVPRKTVHDAIVALNDLFKQLGKPKRLIADRAAAFRGVQFKNFCQDLGVELHLIATGMPRGNGQVERVMRTLFNLMRATLNEQDEHKWVTILKGVESDINNTVNDSTGVTPNQLMFGTTEPLISTATFLKMIDVGNSQVPHSKLIEDANTKLSASRRRQQQKFDISRYMSKLFKVGDKVMMADSQLGGKGKLGARYNGPYCVRKLLPNERYELQRKGAKTTVAAHEQLRLWPDDNSN